MTIEIRQLGLKRPLPIQMTAVSQPFWDGLAHGQFLLACCQDCHRLSFPPRTVCPGCHGQNFTWQQASGNGVIYSVTRIQTSPPVYDFLTPTSLAIVDLEEDVRLLTRVLPGNRAPKIGDSCRLIITSHPDGYFYAVAANTDDE